jgi:hypothetical protein
MSSTDKAKGGTARDGLRAARREAKVKNFMAVTGRLAGKGSGVRRGRRGQRVRVLTFAFCLLPFAFLSAACRQDMHDQPKYTPLTPSAFFPDGRSARPLVEGTVARGQLREDVLLYTGKLAPGQQAGQQASAQQGMLFVGNMSANQSAAIAGDRLQLGSQGQATASDSGAANQKGNTTAQQATPGLNTQAGQQPATQTYQVRHHVPVPD